jgi:hypothetical protein
MNPNMAKNRIPTPKEEQILRQSIKDEGKKLEELDGEISELQTRMERYRDKIKELDSALCAAKKLHENAEKALLALSELSGALLEDDIDNSEIIETGPQFPSCIRMRTLGKGLGDIHATYLVTAQSTLKLAQQEHRNAEEEYESNGSLLHYASQCLEARIELRARLGDTIRQMKDIVGPHRRVPNELWSAIFWERVTEDEEDYGKTWRSEAPPYTTLKLTWVCQLWRQIVTNQSALWRYISIPNSIYVSPSQRDRVELFKLRVKTCSPSIYMTPGSVFMGKNKIHLKSLLGGFNMLKRLELRVFPDVKPFELLLKELELHIEELALISLDKGRLRDITINLSYQAIKNVNAITCSSIRPRIDTVTFQDKQAQLYSLRLYQLAVDNKETIAFLEASGVTFLNLDMRHGCTFPEDNFVDSDKALTCLEAIKAPFSALSLFNRHVYLPNLRTLQLTRAGNMSATETLRVWDSFITSHDRKDTIETLELSGLPEIESPSDAAKFCSDLIIQLPNLVRLFLTGNAAAPSLQSMTDSKNFPPKLDEINICAQGNVTEGHILAFMEAYYAEDRDYLFLNLRNCTSLSSEAKIRLNLAHESFEGEKELENAYLQRMYIAI